MEGQSLVQPVVGDLADIYGMIAVYRVLAFIAMGLSAISLFLIGRPHLPGKKVKVKVEKQVQYPLMLS
ncbi:MAG: hypothetical protein NTV30_05280 [Chloroflexi bacterium]|nr:hypothetical protein [Chloroflexota bacterium]